MSKYIAPHKRSKKIKPVKEEAIVENPVINKNETSLVKNDWVKPPKLNDDFIEKMNRVSDALAEYRRKEIQKEYRRWANYYLVELTEIYSFITNSKENFSNIDFNTFCYFVFSNTKRKYDDRLKRYIRPLI